MIEKNMNRMPNRSETEAYHLYSLRAMNTLIEIVYYGTKRKAREAHAMSVQWFKDVEQRFSRFLPSSELSELNQLSGYRCFVSEPMLEVVTLADLYQEETNGLFHPLLLGVLRSAGYADSFETLHSEPASGSERNEGTADEWSTTAEAESTMERCSISSPAERIEINTGMRTILLPEGSEMDLGGIVKSWSVRRLANWLQKTGKIARGMINAGGDLTVWFEDKEDPPKFTIDIAHPWLNDITLETLTATNGSVATSGTRKRQWTTAQGRRHHLIDPRTMRPSESDILQCTVVGPDVVDCEIWAKVLCILGSRDGLDLFLKRKQGYGALLYTDGNTLQYFGECHSKRFELLRKEMG